MWHTPNGDRTLSGTEAILVASMARRILDEIGEEVEHSPDLPSWTSGVDLFDAQSFCQRLALLQQVCQHLLHSTESTLDLSAEVEATVMAIYEMLKEQVNAEIQRCHLGIDSSCTLRTQILDACQSLDPSDEDLPDPWSDDEGQWDLIIESLADQVLWDRDFEMAALIVDEDPQTAATYKQLLGIEENYFSMAPPEMEENTTRLAIQEMRDFLNSKYHPEKPR